MKLNDLTNQAGEWLRGSGPMSEVVISSRMRLARNLAGQRRHRERVYINANDIAGLRFRGIHALLSRAVHHADAICAEESAAGMDVDMAYLLPRQRVLHRFHLPGRPHFHSAGPHSHDRRGLAVAGDVDQPS